MNNHNQHNENTPNTPQADASQLSDEQQALLTAEALGQLEPGSGETAEAAKIRTGQHRTAAEQLAADTTKIADALQSAAAQETALLADDPARKEMRQAVLAAIARRGSVTPAANTETAAQQKKSGRLVVRWLSGLASLAAVIAVIFVVLIVIIHDDSLVVCSVEASCKSSRIHGCVRSRGQSAMRQHPNVCFTSPGHSAVCRADRPLHQRSSVSRCAGGRCSSN